MKTLSLKENREKFIQLQKNLNENLLCFECGRPYPVYGFTKKVGFNLYKTIPQKYLAGKIFLEWNDSLGEILIWCESSSIAPQTMKFIDSVLLGEVKTVFPKQSEAPKVFTETYYEACHD